MALNAEFFDKIAAKIIEKGEPDDLAKFMLSGNEHIAAVQRYFYNLEAEKKKFLWLNDDTWALDSTWTNTTKTYTGLALFKFLAWSIVPFVEELLIYNTRLEDYPFLKDVKNLKALEFEFTDQEYIKVLSGLSNLEAVDDLWLNFKRPNLQLLSTLPFSFNRLTAFNFIFERNFECEKVFQASHVELCGDEDAKTDLFFEREHYQYYATIFPNADLVFDFHIKVVDDFSDLLKASTFNFEETIQLPGRYIRKAYNFYDYNGHSYESNLLRMLQNSDRWFTEECPHYNAFTFSDPGEVLVVTCTFPWIATEVGNKLAEKSLRRVPEDSNGNPGDYYRISTENKWGHKADFEILKTASLESFRSAYAEIAGVKEFRIHFEAGDRSFGPGTIADNFHDGDNIVIQF